MLLNSLWGCCVWTSKNAQFLKLFNRIKFKHFLLFSLLFESNCPGSARQKVKYEVIMSEDNYRGNRWNVAKLWLSVEWGAALDRKYMFYAAEEEMHFNDLDSVLAWWRCGKYSTSGHVVRWGGNSEAGNRFHIASSAGTLFSRCLKVTPIGSISWYFEFKAKWVIQFNWVDGPLMEFRAVSCLTKQVLVGAHLSITRRTIVHLFVRKRYCNLDAPSS